MIAIIGIAGSGKSTQRDLLAKQLNCPWVYTGELLRKNLAGDLKKDLADGKPIDDRITIALLERDFKEKNAKNQECILDGSPRYIEQAQWFVGLVKSAQIKLTGVIHLVMTPEEAAKRLSDRGRHDDSQQGIDQRFKVYETYTKPVLDYLKIQGIDVHDVDATASIEESRRNYASRPPD
jgi:adenylate kinase family enzyme